MFTRKSKAQLPATVVHPAPEPIRPPVPAEPESLSVGFLTFKIEAKGSRAVGMVWWMAILVIFLAAVVAPIVSAGASGFRDYAVSYVRQPTPAVEGKPPDRP